MPFDKSGQLDFVYDFQTDVSLSTVGNLFLFKVFDSIAGFRAHYSDLVGTLLTIFET